MSAAVKTFQSPNSDTVTRPSAWEQTTAFPHLRPQFASRFPEMVGACRMFGCDSPLCGPKCERETHTS